MTVEWHTIEDYRVRFDIRVGASRFIIVRGIGNLVGKGLIDGALGRGSVGTIVWDHVPVPSGDVLWIAQRMLDRWTEMQERLHTARAAAPSLTKRQADALHRADEAVQLATGFFTGVLRTSANEACAAERSTPSAALAEYEEQVNHAIDRIVDLVRIEGAKLQNYARDAIERKP